MSSSSKLTVPVAAKESIKTDAPVALSIRVDGRIVFRNTNCPELFVIEIPVPVASTILALSMTALPALSRITIPPAPTSSMVVPEKSIEPPVRFSIKTASLAVLLMAPNAGSIAELVVANSIVAAPPLTWKAAPPVSLIRVLMMLAASSAFVSRIPSPVMAERSVS